MEEPVLFICLDGCSPEYLHKGNCLNIEWLCEEGYGGQAFSVVPTVTNVNNVSLITGDYPDGHGISSNCYYERLSGSEVYMEASGFITAETIFEKVAKLGLKTALLTVKEKLCTLLSRGVEVALSAENPPGWAVGNFGLPPSIYSAEVNAWLLKAAKGLLSRLHPHLVYLATTDYIMHKHRPEEAEAKRQMGLIDACIGEIVDEFPGISLYITADHGMSDKMRALDVEAVLGRAGISARVIPTVKDRYVLHHSNLSGSAYVYLEDIDELGRAYETLVETRGIEEVLTRSEAAVKYRLPRERIGDLFLNGSKDYTFGCFRDGCEVRDVSVRSHGSLHERQVPWIIYGAEAPCEKVVENKDLTQLILTQLSHKSGLV